MNGRKNLELPMGVADIQLRDCCRLCGSGNLELAVPLTASPIADDYVDSSCLGVAQHRYPLDLYLCQECGHIQNIHVVNPELLFRRYLFTTGSSPNLVVHFKNYAKEVIYELGIRAGSLVVEIGSNDGTLLREFRAEGMRVLGIDPAHSIANAASAAGIETIPEFFDQRVASLIRSDYGSAKLVCANNVFAHSDNLSSVAEGVREILADDGVFVFEVTYLVDLIDKMLFDTVYHEHVSYHSIKPLSRFLNRHGMELIKVLRITSKGGSIRCFAQRKRGGGRLVDSSVAQHLELEMQRGFDRLPLYRGYSASIAFQKSKIIKFLEGQSGCGTVIAGYGASTTTTTLMWHFDLTRILSFVVDDNPVKHGLYCPGSHIPVVPSGELYVRAPNVVVILAWQYSEAIVKKHAAFLRQGGQFVIPLPELTVLSA
jgi:hypothetical protein